jgi:hypothetical protein
MPTVTRDFARNATLGDLSTMLQEQQARKVDVVAPASSIRSRKGVLRIKGVEPYIDEQGVTLADGWYRPTAIADEGFADKLGIPLAYMRRLRHEHTDLLDDNINGWLARDQRKFLIRCFRGDEQGSDRKVPGMARAFLSDRFAIMDNLDALLAALDGVREAGVEVNIAGCDLTERRMVVRVECPQVWALAPTLLAGYRSPFPVTDGPHSGYDDSPVVWAGFQLANSETGGGAFTITPRVTIKVCKNGLTMTKDAMRAVHLGGTLEAGTVAWSAETQTRAVALVRSKTVDAVRSFLSPEYLSAKVSAIEEAAGAEVKDVDHVKTITKGLSFTQEQTDSILGFFIKGGQMTVGGVANAATAYAQEVSDPEVAYAMEAGAARLLMGA